MLSSLSRNSRRALALALLLMLLILLALALLVPLRNAFVHSDERIEELQFRLQKYTRLASQETTLRTRLAELSKQQANGEELLTGASTAIAGANLQALFKQVVQQAGGRLESTQVLPEHSEGVMDRIGIRAQFSGNIDALQKVLYGIEFRKPILFVEKMEIRAKRVRRSRRRNKPVNAAKLLSVSLEVSGYRRAEDQG